MDSGSNVQYSQDHKRVFAEFDSRLESHPDEIREKAGIRVINGRMNNIMAWISGNGVDLKIGKETIHVSKQSLEDFMRRNGIVVGEGRYNRKLCLK